MVRKVIQRGSCPPIHPDSERALLEAAGLGSQITRKGDLGDIAPRLSVRIDETSLRGALGWQADEIHIDDDLRLDSEEEQEFFASWIHRNLADTAARWVIPQAPLDLMLSAAGVADNAGSRRVDFLLSTPWGTPTVIEIDGEQHASATQIDLERDSQLRMAGYSVMRVPAREITQGDSQHLTHIRELWTDESASFTSKELLLVHGGAQLHRLVLALLEALAAGFVAGDRWIVGLKDPLEIPIAAIRPYLDLFAAIDDLWGGFVCPGSVVFVHDDTWTHFTRTANGFVEGPAEEDSLDVMIHLESNRSPVDMLPSIEEVPIVVVRSASLPVEILDPFMEGGGRVAARTTGSQTAEALRTILQTVFAKDDFREGQLTALTQVLEGGDCAVLLPTGAGKSLIYQLAGLCLPGRTLIVDPIIALMEDQVEGLRAHGIDRIVSFSSYLVSLGQREQLLEQVRSADAYFIFVSPERLQQQSFRSALRELSTTTPVNLAVVDEAHCVSEWGHDFRTAYLNLGSVLRATCEDSAGNPPPLLALTGTASRAVLKDVLIELGIDRRSHRAVVRPRSFDRPELRYEIIRTDPSECRAVLSGFIRSLPGRFNRPHADFFRPKSDQTFSGVVFCAHRSGEHGVTDVAEHLRSVVGFAPGIYAGSAPRGFSRGWEETKRRNANAFKGNDTPLLVSTKAFGMGIDKPNIRYIAHYGIPGSIEAFYQEVGRAGRDGKQAICGLILCEYDEQRARQLLDDEEDLEATRFVHDDVERSSCDDITRMLFFHLSSFRGLETEMGELEEVLDVLGDLSRKRHVSIPMPDDDNLKRLRERAIHRLVLLGVIGDYLVDWGSKKFDLAIEPASMDSVVEHLFNYVERNQPGRAAAIRDALTRDWEKPRQAVLECASALIGFVYDTVERSRRRSLREMWLAAREADDDAALRRRILDYLTEGDLAPTLERLVDREEFRFMDWIVEYERILTDEDIREWRGNAARLLTSYPDHPGLLLGRGLSEMLDPNGDLREFTSNLVSALTSARSRYGVAEQEGESLAAWIFRLCSARRPEALAPALVAFGEAETALEVVDEVSRASLADGDCDPGVAVVALASIMEGVSRRLGEVEAEFVGR